MTRRSSRSGRGRRGRKPKRERKIDLERYRSIIPDWTSFTEAAGRPEPTVFRVRSGRIPEERLLGRLEEQGFRSRPVDGLPGFHQVESGPGPVSMTVEHWLGLIYVQQASTGVAAPQVGPLPGEHVLDLCSAPGGKTTHMAELMQDTGCLVASEISEPRIRGLLGNVYRLGHSNILVTACDGRDFPEEASFDRVLVDAPCSGEGTLRRRGGQAPNQSSSFLGFVTRAQRALLEKAVRVTKPGGTILYVTCTFSPEENEAVVSDALDRLPVELEPLKLPVPSAPGVTSFEGTTYDPRLEGAARIYPHHLDSGGLFLAKLRRLEGSVPSGPPVNGSARNDTAEIPSAAVGGSGWSSPTTALPGEESDEAAATEVVSRGVEEIVDRFEITRDLSSARWVLRGGRAWLHTIDAWPLESWQGGDWRTISVGFRAIDFDSRGRPRPTNDFLRWLGEDVGARVLDVSPLELEQLLTREAVETDFPERGPVALRHRGDLVGRGAVTVDGLKSEIPRARASDLLRILSG